jgi:hypothetical protein
VACNDELVPPAPSMAFGRDKCCNGAAALNEDVSCIMSGFALEKSDKRTREAVAAMASTPVRRDEPARASLQMRGSGETSLASSTGARRREDRINFAIK